MIGVPGAGGRDGRRPLDRPSGGLFAVNKRHRSENNPNKSWINR